MPTTKTFAGSSFNLPLNREPKSSNWGTETSNFLIALADNAIPKTGGSYTLSAELNLGATYGLLAPYLKSAGTNIASAGVVRLAKTETIGFRNNANSADLALAVNGSDQLTFGGVVLATAGAASIVNADISVTAAIAYSKLAALTAGSVLLGSASNVATVTALSGDVTVGNTGVTAIGAGKVTNAMLAGSIAYSKLALTGAVLNADLAGSIAYSKLSLSGSVATADLASGFLVPLGKGGTGQTTANAALNALLPDQSSSASKVLSTDGTNTSWASAASSALNQYNTDIGNGSNSRTATNTNLLGDVTATTNSQTYAVTNAAPGVFTITGHGFLTGDKAYVTVTQNGFTANTTYFIHKIDANTFHLCTTLANAVASTGITSSGATAGTIVTGGLALSPTGRPGIITGAAQTTGYVGEYLEGTCTNNVNVSTTNTYGDITGATVTLTPGVWMIGYHVTAAMNRTSGSAAAYFNLRSGSSTETANTFAYFGWDTTLSQHTTTLSVSTVVNITSATTYKLSGQTSDGTNNALNVRGNADLAGSSTAVWALRIR